MGFFLILNGRLRPVFKWCSRPNHLKPDIFSSDQYLNDIQENWTQKRQVFECSRDLNTGQVWYLNGRKLSDHQMVCYSMPFEYRTKFSPVFRPPFKNQTGIQMVV